MIDYGYDPKDLIGYHVGDVIKLDSKYYMISKKTSTAIAVERWYWFDRLGKWIGGKLGL